MRIKSRKNNEKTKKYITSHANSQSEINKNLQKSSKYAKIRKLRQIMNTKP